MGESYLKTQRVALQLSQEAMAERLGISRATYAAYERGDRELPAHTLFLMERITHVPAKIIWERMGGRVQAATE